MITTLIHQRVGSSELVINVKNTTRLKTYCKCNV